MEPNLAGMMIWKRILLSTNEFHHSWGEPILGSKRGILSESSKNFFSSTSNVV